MVPRLKKVSTQFMKWLKSYKKLKEKMQIYSNRMRLGELWSCRKFPVLARPSTLSLLNAKSIWIAEQFQAKLKTPSKKKWTSLHRAGRRPGKWEHFIEKAGRERILRTSHSTLPGKLTCSMN